MLLYFGHSKSKLNRYMRAFVTPLSPRLNVPIEEPYIIMKEELFVEIYFKTYIDSEMRKLTLR